VTEDIRALTTRLAEEPGSLAFLELAEALRRRGQLEAAGKVARGGLSKYPGLADAHDLMARILSDQGDLAGAFDAWADALRIDPMRTGALKGIAFLYFRAGDAAAAESRAEPIAPADPGSPFADMDGGRSLVLVDANGLRLAGSLPAPSGEETGDRVAAQLAGVSREAARATRLLGLGTWQSITLESSDGHFVLVRPTGETVLLAAREQSLPMARVVLLAERAARAARQWLEQVR
jgi:predicted regulator of Ras-like GTPase activity (Roadblock/LC7/MglB family)